MRIGGFLAVHTHVLSLGMKHRHYARAAASTSVPSDGKL